MRKYPNGERHWRKSSYSPCFNPHQCVEVSIGEDIMVRDSKNPEGGALTFTKSEWQAFVKGVLGGEFAV